MLFNKHPNQAALDALDEPPSTPHTPRTPLTITAKSPHPPTDHQHEPAEIA